MSSMADQIGPAIDNINLFDELREKTVCVGNEQSRTCGGVGTANGNRQGAAGYGELAHGTRGRVGDDP